MYSKRIFLTAVIAVLSGYAIVGVADESASFVNLDYAAHADGVVCTGTDTNGDGRADTGTASQGGGEPVAGITTGVGVTPATVATTATVAGGGKTPLILNLPAMLGTVGVGCNPTSVTTATAVATVTTPSAFPTFYFNTGTGEVFDTTNQALTTTNPGVIDSDATTGRPYAVEILQSGDWTLPSGETGATTPTPKYAGVVYTIDGWINQRFSITFSLEGAVFDGEPLFAIANSNQTSSATAHTGYYPYYGFSRIAAASGKNTVSFDAEPSKATNIPKGAPNGTINNQSVLLLLYKMRSVTPLQTAGGEVKMKASFKAAGFGTSPTVNRELERVVATSTDSLAAKIFSEDAGIVYISVNEKSKSFTDTGDNATRTDTATEDAFREITVARIGYLQIGGVDAYQPDGVNFFTVGSDLGAAGESSELVIKGGQFAASMKSPGTVRLFDPTVGAVNPIASALSTDGSELVIKLTNDILKKISNSTNGKGVAIEFVVDKVTEVNLVEAPPTATLTVVFEDADIKIGDELAASLTDVPLRQIFQDGVVCWAFNVPYMTVQDRFNIRITNESSVPGSMSVTLYEASGTEVASGVELKNIQDANGQFIFPTLKSETELGTGTGTDKNLLPAGHTLFINSEVLETALGTAWSGRAVLRIVSELPEVEMLAMLRNQLMDEASQPLNNLSLGAHGISCVQGGQ